MLKEFLKVILTGSYSILSNILHLLKHSKIMQVGLDNGLKK